MQTKEWIQLVVFLLTVVVFYFKNQDGVRREIKESVDKLSEKIDLVQNGVNELRVTVARLEERIGSRPAAPAPAPTLALAPAPEAASP